MLKTFKRGVTFRTEAPDQEVHHLSQPLLEHLLGVPRLRGELPQPAAARGGDPDHTIQD